MKTIWKYRAADVESLPRGAKVLHVDIQDNVIMLWAEIDTDADQVTRRVAVVGTGHLLPDEFGTHIGSVLQGPYVWHLYIEDDPA